MTLSKALIQDYFINAKLDYKVQNYSFLSEEGASVLLVLALKDLAFKTDSRAEIVLCLSYLQEELNNSELSLDYYKGITGFGWLINHLQGNKYLIDLETSFLDSIDNLILSYLRRVVSNENQDFLNGSMGLLVYCASRLMKDNMLDFHEILLKWTGTLQLNEVKKIKTSSNNQKEIPLNLGLAHGLSGKIIFLAQMIKLDNKFNYLKRIILDLIGIIKSCKFTSNSISIYPTNFGDSTSIWSRLAWCNGDLGIALAYYHAGIVCEKNDLVLESLQLFYKSMTRINTANTGIDEAGICHGSAGVALIYNRIYLHTRKKDFRQSALFWANKTFKYFVSQGGIENYTSWQGDIIGKKRDNSFLNGSNGIVAALISVYFLKSYNWDEGLLIY